LPGGTGSWEPGPLGRAHAGSSDCFTYIGPPNGPTQRPKAIRYVQYECYETTARSETRKLAPCAARALPRLGNMAFKKVVKMGT
jgi:hypothetical protein